MVGLYHRTPYWSISNIGDICRIGFAIAGWQQCAKLASKKRGSLPNGTYPCRLLWLSREKWDHLTPPLWSTTLIHQEHTTSSVWSWSSWATTSIPKVKALAHHGSRALANQLQRGMVLAALWAQGSSCKPMLWASSTSKALGTVLAAKITVRNVVQAGCESSEERKFWYHSS